jgi:hypothetical protein
MKTYARFMVFAFTGVSLLALAACGEGYTPVKIRGQVPYTEERTAGPGIAYVRAHMMPEKTVVLPAPLTAPVAPAIEDAEPMFEKKMIKK